MDYRVSVMSRSEDTRSVHVQNVGSDNLAAEGESVYKQTVRC